MRRRSFVPWAILVLSIATAVVFYRSLLSDVFEPGAQVRNIGNAPSKIYAHLLIQYDKPPVYQEEYDMQDLNGATSYSYRIRSYAGKQITITAPPHATYDVSFFFGRLDQDGVWQLTNKPPRPDARAHYTVYVRQIVDFKEGSRTVTFTNPKYWATVPGRQYQIDLSKTNPNDLLKLNSQARNDPAYQTVVNEFLTFGPPEFREQVAAVRKRLGAGPVPL
jgi:hypothetical protein